MSNLYGTISGRAVRFYTTGTGGGFVEIGMGSINTGTISIYTLPPASSAGVLLNDVNGNLNWQANTAASLGLSTTFTNGQVVQVVAGPSSTQLLQTFGLQMIGETVGGVVIGTAISPLIVRSVDGNGAINTFSVKRYISAC